MSASIPTPQTSRDLGALIERVERAEGPDRTLDAEIVVAFDIRPDWCGDKGKLWVDKTALVEPVIRLWTVGKKPSAGNAPIGDYPAYTASIDAAVALVERMLPGYSWEIRRSGFGNPAQAALWNPKKAPGQGNIVRAESNSGCAPLALVSALLRALQTREER